MHALLHSMPPAHSAGHCWPMTPGHLQASLGQSLVGSLLLSPGSWCTRFCFCPARVCFPVLCKFWGSMVGLIVTSSKRAYAIPRSAAARAPVPETVHCWPIPPQDILKHSSVSVSVGSLGPGATKVCLSPLSISSGFYCKCNFDLPTIGNLVKFPFFYPLIDSILWNSNLTVSLSFPYLSGRYRQPWMPYIWQWFPDSDLYLR